MEKSKKIKKQVYFIEVSFKNFFTFYTITSNKEKQHPYIEIYTPYTSCEEVSWFPVFFSEGRKKQRGINGTLVIFKSIKDYHDYWKWTNSVQKKKELFDKDAYTSMIDILQNIQKQHEAEAVQQFSTAKESLGQIQSIVENSVM